MESWSKIKSKLTQADSSEKAASSAARDLKAKKCPACGASYIKTRRVVCPHDGTLLLSGYEVETDLASHLRERLIDNRYEVGALIGEGELTKVFKAFDMETKSDLVIKIVKSHMLGDIGRLNRLAATLQETVELRHERIASIMHVGISKTSKSALIPQLYYVTEKLDGMNLRKILRDFGVVAPYVVIQSIIQVCQTLEYAANAGWYHKNLKPSNIYVSQVDDEPSIKITDFGVAERMFRNLEWQQQGTKTGSIYGNPSYVCPDVIFGSAEPSAVTEIYCLGCVMYHVLKGMPPFEGTNDFDTLMMHGAAEPRPFAAALKIPADLEAIVMKCLSKQPDKRYQTFSELEEALNAVKTI